MDDIEFKTKYQRYKYKVKVWEKDFRKKNNRIPSKHDIHEAPQEIRYSYKMYYKLKTSILEDTLSDALFEDGFDIFDVDNSQSTESGFLQHESDTFLPNIPKGLSQLTSSSPSFSNLEDLKQISSGGLIALTNKININDDHVIKEFEAVELVESNKSAWIDCSVKSSKINKKKSSSPQKTQFKSNLSAKLFKSSSFSKRNPRKSLSRLNSCNLNSTQGSSSSNNSLRESLPDLETILTQKATEPNLSSMICKNPLLKSKEISTDINRGWLDRCGKELGMDDFDLSSTTSVENKQKFGLSNLNIPINVENKIPETLPPVTPVKNFSKDDSDEVISNSEEETTETVYRQIVKRRRVLVDVDKTPPVLNKETINKIPLNISEESIKKEIFNNNNGPKKNLKEKSNPKKNLKKKSKSNDEYDSSQSESKMVSKKKSVKSEKKIIIKDKMILKRPKRTTNRKTKKRQTASEDETKQQENKPEDMKYQLALEVGNLISIPSVNLDELKQAESVIEKYTNSVSIEGFNKIEKNKLEIKENTEKSRALRDKIAQGKLNENFVRININKKIFVRGKKPFNFSKYKKKIWKHQKKVSALCGPEMDMGGCDGGVLKCFKCGQVGHFAQQCKIKGDSLAVYDPEEEIESPFPTLEEAHKMACLKATVVHSTNIQEQPKASNFIVNEKDINKVDCDVKDNGEISNAFDEEFEFEECIFEHEKNLEPTSVSYIGHKIPEEFLKMCGLLEQNTSKTDSEAFYKLKPDGTVIETTAEVMDTLKMFGHTNFRKGQDRAIMRILSGQSTLVTLSTGSGKSLCYQLPAYMYGRFRKCITLVISPLVSLMEDQVYGVPKFLRAHCLHTNQTPQQRLKTMEIIKSGKIDILLISPEAVVAGEKSTGFGSILRQLPPIAFACIDEAHCVSQWSHNFRPSYLMICKVLKNNLGIKTILGLTATATLPTKKSIIQHLNIKDGMTGVISDIPLPDNLILTVSKDPNKDMALIQLLRSPRFDSCHSIIIYCTRRDECERISAHIRTCLQDKKPENETTKKRKRINWNAEPYHAGLPASRRRTIQSAFMKNELRIVVATVAFGMGINKSDIRSVLHYNMPRNFESYVQEVGRAGRDGKLAHCHLFLDSRGSDQNELRRHIYANSIDRHVIRKLLQKVFVLCSCNKNFEKCDFVSETEKDKKNSKNLESITENVIEKLSDEFTEEFKPRNRTCPGHEIGFSIEKIVEELDIPEQNIATLLCYLELDGRYMLNILSSAYTMCKVISYAGANQLKKAAKECPPLAMAIASALKKGTFDDKQNIFEFSVIEISSAIGWNSGVVKYQLKNLEWTKDIANNKSKRSSISVTFFDLGLRIRAPGDFLPHEIDNALDLLHNRSVHQEKNQLIQLQCVFEGLSSLAFDTCQICCKADFNIENSDKLKLIIRDYFQNDYPKNITLKEHIDDTTDDQILIDCRSMINMYPDNNFTGRSLARIFHGIQSPNYPAVIWGRSNYWRSHINTNFNRIVNLGNQLIVRMRT